MAHRHHQEGRSSSSALHLRPPAYWKKTPLSKMRKYNQTYNIPAVQGAGGNNHIKDDDMNIVQSPRFPPNTSNFVRDHSLPSSSSTWNFNPYGSNTSTTTTHSQPPESSIYSPFSNQKVLSLPQFTDSTCHNSKNPHSNSRGRQALHDIQQSPSSPSTFSYFSHQTTTTTTIPSSHSSDASSSSSSSSSPLPTLPTTTSFFSTGSPTKINLHRIIDNRTVSLPSSDDDVDHQGRRRRSNEALWPMKEEEVNDRKIGHHGKKNNHVHRHLQESNSPAAKATSSFSLFPSPTPSSAAATITGTTSTPVFSFEGEYPTTTVYKSEEEEEPSQEKKNHNHKTNFSAQSAYPHQSSSGINSIRKEEAKMIKTHNHHPPQSHIMKTSSPLDIYYQQYYHSYYPSSSSSSSSSCPPSSQEEEVEVQNKPLGSHLY